MKCVICYERPAKGALLMCGTCGRSYDRDARRVGDVAEAIAWAAQRARRFERARARKSRAGGTPEKGGE